MVDAARTADGPVERTGPTPDPDRPFLIQVSSLSKTSREPFLQAISPHYRVWLFIGGAGRTQAPTWEPPYLTGHTEVDTLDADAMLAAARALDARLRAEHGRGVEGVICYDEARVIATARLATALGLPTSPPEAVARCRDKHATRRALAAAGVPQAASRAVRSIEEGLAAAAELGYPVVLKPRNMAASFGVSRADTPERLAEAYRHALSIVLPEEPTRYEDGVLVEEYLAGPEISVDVACFGGRVVPMAVAHKECGFEPSFEETGHLVDARDPLYQDPELLDVLARAHAAVGYHTGTTHVELRRTTGGLKVVEINARLGGDMIPLLGRLATGVDPNLAAADIACGREPALRTTWERVAAVRFAYPERDMTVAQVQIAEAGLPPEIERADILAAPGQAMLLPPRGSAWESRLAQVIAVADSRRECLAALDAGMKAVVVTEGETAAEGAQAVVATASGMVAAASTTASPRNQATEVAE